jgi:hypothetical protein
MPSLKNQHFVPQFFLTRFVESGAKRIALYNLRARKYVPVASIRHQCSKDFFYGKNPAFESLLADLDSMHSRFFRVLVDRGEVPRGTSRIHFSLISFAVIQYMRTAARRDERIALLKESRDYVSKIETIPAPGGIGSATSDTTHWADGVIDGLEAVPLALDLDVKLIVNTGKSDFIVSDNPVVLQNRFQTERRRSGTKGIASIGLQMLYPIDARHAVIAFDREVYRVGSPSAGVVQVSNKTDIRKMNELQVLNAADNVFFPDSFDESLVCSLVEPMLGKRKPIRPIITSFVEQGEGTNRFVRSAKTHLAEHESALRIVQPSERYEHCAFSFATINDEARNRVLDDGLSQVRDQSIANAFYQLVEDRDNNPAKWQRDLTRFYKKMFAVLEHEGYPPG